VSEYDAHAPLFARFAALADDHPDRIRLRDELVTAHLPVAQHIARRFAHRGEPQEDLEQVATVGLIHAVDRFDPTRGIDFLSYAVPTITGEVRRHFRDQSWSVRVPRRLKDMHVTLGSAAGELSQRLGRAPTPRELAAHLDLPVDQVLDGLEAASAYRSASLDDLLAAEDHGGTLSDLLGEADAAMDRVDDRETVAPLLAQLPDRERTILVLRFFGGMTQTQIAQRVGISQMHVSRLLAQTLSMLRDRAAED
jgi:RNA polymerase sigma-B factor